MPEICPSILAETPQQYREQMEKIGHFAERIQIDLTDGIFTHSKTVTPQEAWWPVGIKADFHLMYEHPGAAVDTILEHQPNLIIMHAEAKGNFAAFADRCHNKGVKVGVAILPHTPVSSISSGIALIDHALVFSGDLGSFGGRANFDLLRKVDEIKQLKLDIEVGWDGGINDQNISHLAAAGVDVFNVGGFIQESTHPEHAYKVLRRIADETGTT